MSTSHFSLSPVHSSLRFGVGRPPEQDTQPQAPDDANKRAKCSSKHERPGQHSNHVSYKALTALAQDRQKFAGLAFGADQYLVKPVMPSELVAAVQQAVLVSEADRQRRMQTLLEQEETGEEAEAPAPQARSPQEPA